MTKFLAAAFVLLASTVSAQTSLSVDHTSDDAVGIQIAHELKELIRGSHGFTLEDVATSDFEITLESMDLDTPNPQGKHSAWTIILTRSGGYLGSQMGIHGSAKTREAAKYILALVDTKIQKALAATPLVPTSTRLSR